MPKNKRTLLLNSDNSIANVISYRDSITGWFLNKYYCVSYYNETIRSAGGKEFPIPAVVVSQAFNKKKKIRCTAFNLFSRDGFHCGYCLTKHKPKDLTRDHIIPREKGGKTNWMNLVTCCGRCNSRKANKIWEPKIKIWEPTNIIQLYDEIPQEWENYVKRD